MGDDVARFVVQCLKMLIKPVFSLIIFTYAWVILGAVWLVSITSWPETVEALVIGGASGIWLYLLLQRVVRLITGNPDFSFLHLGSFKKTKNKPINPMPDKAFIFPEPEGYPIGRRRSPWVCLPDDMEYHALIVGGSGSGKTSTQVIPLLLKSKLPAFCVDIKGELYEKTSPILSRRAEIKRFNPADPDAWGYDPFALVKTESCILDMTTIAAALVPVTPGTKDDFWPLEAQNFLAGSLLFAWKQRSTFTEAMRVIQSSAAVDLVTAAVHHGDEDVKVFMGHFDGMAVETLTSIHATMSSKIMVFASDPDLRRAFSSSRTISPLDILEGRYIFLQLPEARLDVYRHATQLIIGQFLKFFESQPDGHGPKVNFVLDEFFRLGKLTSVESGMATLRSKGVRIHAITQSLAQIEQLYERVGARALADNFNVKVLLSATEPESQDYFSKLIGSFEKTMRSTSSNQQTAKFGGSSGVSYSEQERKIIRPEELGQLGEECLLFTPKGWTRVSKQPYYSTKQYQ